MSTEIAPLSHPQQIFLQRLLASHVLTNEEAQHLWDEINEMDGRGLGRDLRNTLSVINRSLKPGFGMEIRSVSLYLEQGQDSTSVEDDRNLRQPTIYYSIVNCEPDSVATASVSVLTKNPHQLAFINLIMERLIENFNNEMDQAESEEDEEMEEEPTTSSAGKRSRPRNTNRNIRTGMGCQAVLSRMDVINLRTELKGPHKDKLTVGQVERTIDMLEDEGWLVPGVISSSAVTPDSSARRVRRKGPHGGSSTGLQLGPRTYMELADFLTNIGLDKKLLPQFLVHG